MNCEDYDILLSARLDGELTRQEEADLEAHLAQCPRCRRQAQELEELRWQTLSLTAEVPGRLKSWLADQDWAALPQDDPAGEPDETPPADPDLPSASPDLPVALSPVQADAPQKNRRRKLPWLLCGAAAAILLVVGLCQILLPNSMGGGFSQAMMEVFHQEEATLADRDDVSQEDADRPDGQEETEQAENQETDEPDQQDPSGNQPDTPSGTHDPSTDSGQSGETGEPSNPGGQDTPNTDPGTDDPGTGEEPGTDEDPDEPPDPPSNGMTQQQAQELLTAHLAAQGRPLSLLPLGSSGGMWRFSGKDDTGRVVSFFMVNQLSGEIQEVPVPPPEEGPTAGPGGLS